MFQAVILAATWIVILSTVVETLRKFVTHAAPRIAARHVVNLVVLSLLNTVAGKGFHLTSRMQGSQVVEMPGLSMERIPVEVEGMEEMEVEEMGVERDHVAGHVSRTEKARTRPMLKMVVEARPTPVGVWETDVKKIPIHVAVVGTKFKA